MILSLKLDIMKNLALTAVAIIFCSSFKCFSQNSDSSKWFTSTQVATNVWCIDDHGIDNIYLVLGSDSALLIDTGFGLGDLPAYVKSITNLPLIVINTHGHPDHTGGNYQFKTVYAPVRDFELIDYFKSPERRIPAVNSILSNFKINKDELFDDTVNLKPVELKPLSEGHIFRLGGRNLEVISVPGHTPGAICLLDIENKLLFAGDHCNFLVWLHTPDSLPLEVFLQSLKKIQVRATEFSTIMPGHGSPVETSFINEQISCVESILDGSCEGKFYESFAGNGMICTCEKASITYNPENLKIK